MRKYILYLILFLIPLQIFSQRDDEFSRVPQEYYQQISEILLSISNRDKITKANIILEDFSGNWYSGYYSDQLREKIYDVSNVMKKKRMHPFPHYYDFISCLNSFVSNRKDKSSLNAWLIKVNELLKVPRFRTTANFFTFTQDLFNKNLLYQDRNRKWYFDNARYTFENDTAFVIVFEKLNLFCSTSGDSSEIHKTKGRYYPKKNLWIGDGGKVYWKRVGLAADKVYAELMSYEINISLLRYTADSAIFYNKQYFNEPLLGSFKEKIQTNYANDKSSYPRFESFYQEYYFENIFDNISIKGGIGFQGSKMLFMGNGKHYAKLLVTTEDNCEAVFKSDEFSLINEEITSKRSSFVLYYKDDSIFHPKLKMHYAMNNRMISLYQISNANYIPYYDSYHRVDIYGEALYWNLDSTKMIIGSLKSFNNQSKVTFESENFFSERDYYTLQGLDKDNPLVVLSNFHKTYGTDKIKPALLADFMKIPEEQAISILLVLEGKGFLVYDPEKREAILKDRLFEYLKAKAGVSDYDVMRFDSKTKLQSNAIIYLETFDLEINGVDEVFLSRPQKVYIFPKDKIIVMKKNRDFTFSGKVQAGLFSFYSKECSFEYETFRVNLPIIDSLKMLVKKYKTDVSDTLENTTLTTDKTDEEQSDFVEVNSVMEGFSGFVLIDKFNNKSGLKYHPQYPVFTSTSNAFVFYDNKNIRQGAYTRDGFYYELDPFTIDSLDNFSTEGIQFEGYLSSSDIFPTLENPLVVMDDYYLGFKGETPLNGYMVYDQRGRFFNTFALKGDGLTGEGIFDYYNARSTANNFVFYPDSLIATVEDFIITEALTPIEYPGITSKVLDEIFLPKNDELVLKDIDNPFKIYSNALFSGILTVSPENTYGDGDFKFEKALINSRSFQFKHHSLFADTSDFHLYTDTSYSELAFVANGYESQMDFQLRNGLFNSNGISSLLEFPFNQYVCNMDGFEWEIDENIMYLSNKIAGTIDNYEKLSDTELIDVDLSGSEFISIHPEQDSLRFFALTARYDVDNNIINAGGVRIIKVADAAIFPGDGKVNIIKNAQMETLMGASIIANVETKYHEIYGANINIYSRKNYVAAGYYDYYDRDGVPEIITFTSIGVNDSGSTYGLANISDTMNFMLSPHFKYSGNITLSASEKFLKFQGGFNPVQDCYNRPVEWVMFDTIINPDSIIIPVSNNIRNNYNDKLTLSVNYSHGKKGFYPSFFGQKWRSTDIELVSSYGWIKYDYSDKSYLISKDLNVLKDDTGADFFVLDSKQCIMKTYGPINLAVDFPYIDLLSFGKAEYFIIPDSLKMEIALGIDFFLDNDLMNMFIDEMKAANLLGIDLGKTNYPGIVKNVLEKEDSDKVLEEIGLYGASRRVPQELRPAIFIADLNLRWNRKTRSYISKGDLGISSILSTPVNKYVKGYLEIEMRETSPVLNLYIEISANKWFFFSYRSNILQVISSEDRFNDLVMNLKTDKRIIKEKDEDEQYEFVISSKRKRIEFVRKMEEISNK